VAITEKKQYCGGEEKLTTTKICFTYPDASWVCKEPRESYDCLDDGVKLIAHEVAMPRIECKEQEQADICLKPGCRLVSNNTDCLTTDIPTEVRLEDQVCEECKEGRTKLRPGLVQEETCDGSTFQEFCTSGVETKSKWSKTCSFPKTIRAQVLAQVLENTREEENLVEDSGEEEAGHEGDVQEYEPKDRVTERTHESKVVTLKLPDQASQNGADLGGERKSKSSESNQGLAGVDVFFAKQLLSRRGPPSPQTDKDSAAAHEHHHHGPEFKRRGPDDGDVAATFVFEEESEEAQARSTTSSPPTTTSRRPTGMPYVLADQATAPPSPNLFPFSFTERRLPAGRPRSTTTPRSLAATTSTSSPSIHTFRPTLASSRTFRPFTLGPSWAEASTATTRESSPSREGENNSLSPQLPTRDKNLPLTSWENQLNADNADKKAGSTASSSSASRPVERNDGSSFRSTLTLSSTIASGVGSMTLYNGSTSC